MAYLVYFSLLLLSCFATFTVSYKILGLFPHPGRSHFDIFHPIMRGLADTGHDVTVVSIFPDKDPPKNYKDLVLDGMEPLQNSVDLAMFKNQQPFNHFLEFFFLREMGKRSCQNALNSTVIRQLLKHKEHFDVIIMEQFNNDCMMGVAYLINKNAPIIGISSTVLLPWHYERLGNPHIPSYIPALFMGYSEKMNFLQRLANWITVHSFQIMYRLFDDTAINNIILDHLGPGIPDVGELSKGISVMLINQHYSVSGPKPNSPAVIEIGGIHISEPEPIDPILLKLLDTAEHGVIYISWGSMIRAETLPTEKREAILQALGMLPQKVLWKWENDTLPNQPPNVYIQKWLPQREILCHPKVRVFMSHGGLLGTSEAAYCGVPVVSTPIYGDQFLNSAALENRGMGTILLYEDISRDNVLAAVQKALDPSSAANAKKVSYSYKNRPETPLKTAIWWVEHVIKTGGAPHIKSYSVYMPWYIYYSLDVYVVLLGAFSIFLASWIWLIKRLRNNEKSFDKLKKN